MGTFGREDIPRQREGSSAKSRSQGGRHGGCPVGRTVESPEGAGLGKARTR